MKILYAASSFSHLSNFHKPYIKELSKKYDLDILASGDSKDFDEYKVYNIDFRKSVFSPSNIVSVFKIRKIRKLQLQVELWAKT